MARWLTGFAVSTVGHLPALTGSGVPALRIRRRLRCSRGCTGILRPELLIELALPRAELPRDIDDHGHVQAAAAGPGIARQAPARYPQHTAGLGSRRYGDLDLTVGYGNGRGDAERGVGWLDVQVVPQVGSDPGEPGSARVRMVIYASPGGSPARPARGRAAERTAHRRHRGPPAPRGLMLIEIDRQPALETGPGAIFDPAMRTPTARGMSPCVRGRRAG